MQHPLLKRIVTAIAPPVVPILRGPLKGHRWQTHSTSPRFWLSTPEPLVLKACRRHIARRDVVYDVGANVGYMALVCARLGAKVTAFEPYPPNLVWLRRHAALNRSHRRYSLIIEPVAVGATTGSVCFDASRGHAGGQVSDHGIAVPQVSLDDYAASHPPPAFIKVDVEGAELEVLRGAQRLLTDVRPKWLVEIHSPALQQETMQILRDARYRVRMLDDLHVLAVP